jgi:hypothetical protein
MPLTLEHTDPLIEQFNTAKLRSSVVSPLIRTYVSTSADDLYLLYFHSKELHYIIFYLHRVIRHAGLKVAFEACVLELFGSNFGRDIEYPE